MKNWLIAAAIIAAGLSGSSARADGAPCTNCGTSGGYVSGGYTGGSSHLRHPLFTGNHPVWTHGLHSGIAGGSNRHITRMPTLPVYMAAPWYLYWPYDGHFQTVAPMAAAGAFYPPPQANYGNPYMPASYQNYVPGNPVPQFPVGPVSR